MFTSFKMVPALVLALLMLLTAVSPAAAHGSGTEGDLWRHWAWQDLPLLTLIGVVYVRGLRSLWKRAGTGSGISRGQAAMACLGWGVFLFALVSPLDALSEELFTAHMVQHLLLVLVAAPLFVISRFSLALTWALPPRWIKRIWKQWKWKQAWDFMSRPVTAGLLHAAAIWIWHTPRLYEASLHNEVIHFAEHASFFVTAFFFWQVFADIAEDARMVRSARFGLGIFMVFGVMLVSGFLGVLIAFSPYVWYPSYAHETIRYGLTALEDQQLAGTIMWVPSGVAYVAAALLVIWRWLSAMEAVETPQT